MILKNINLIQLINFTELHMGARLTPGGIKQFEYMREEPYRYRVFAEKFIQCIVGVNIFKKNCCVKNLSEYISVSDEAMAFLILANNWDVWEEIAEHGKGMKVENCKSKQRFHVEGKGRGFSWSSQGKLYYNTRFNEILRDREKNGKSFDEYFIGEMRSEDESLKRRKDKRKQHSSNQMEIRCLNDYEEEDDEQQNVIGLGSDYFKNTIPDYDNVKRYKL